MSSTTIHWERILLGGLLAEVALILAIVPLGLRLGDNFLHYTAPPGSFVMCFLDRKSTRLNSSHSQISYAVFCLKKKNTSTQVQLLFELISRDTSWHRYHAHTAI